MHGERRRGLLDTNILILRRGIAAERLPDDVAVSAVTLAELAAGVHLVAGDDADARAERARRTDVLQRAENEFDPLPFDAEAARIYGRLAAAVHSLGRTPRRRVADLMIAATAAANELPLWTTNPADFAGLGDVVEIVPVDRPTAAP
ncbi:type II toxin-antitoxin system VapC family toxin [Cellulomonas shaoxiangyii]|uniref:Ribonuclease VapC n=1 Tax=Cellulomonas shaoxiangyii TaxID=2566013 RepID=A0A4P7SGR8_9CELL|nr:type II toxin-antitoxin system VapC family toxin [Cellulomonas shaoxiangyii]QCB92266.1 type II toxin-antitoxin system VapC family toxin [Cellulomonas shaoxiangyii]TGY85922.1 type II toxin-antitoxin system VapC family toxin [Cellulomonas shaoxiangyii]